MSTLALENFMKELACTVVGETQREIKLKKQGTHVCLLLISGSVYFFFSDDSLE